MGSKFYNEQLFPITSFYIYNAENNIVPNSRGHSWLDLQLTIELSTLHTY
jgi:hypothetical protein